MKHSHVSSEREWGDLGYHLRDLAETIDARSFQALSTGIGIGKTKLIQDPESPSLMPFSQGPRRKTSGIATPAVAPPTAPSWGDVQPMPESYKALNSPQLQPQPRAQLPNDLGALGRFSLFIRRLVALSIDLGVVVASLSLALAVATLALTFLGDREAFWMEGGPLKWFTRFSLVEIGTAVSVVFLVYLGIFRWFAGRTFGGVMAGVPAKNAR